MLEEERKENDLSGMPIIASKNGEDKVVGIIQSSSGGLLTATLFRNNFAEEISEDGKVVAIYLGALADK